jgi:hypothetical protein
MTSNFILSILGAQRAGREQKIFQARAKSNLARTTSDTGSFSLRSGSIH